MQQLHSFIEHILTSCSDYQHNRTKYCPYSPACAIFWAALSTFLIAFIKEIGLYHKLKTTIGMLPPTCAKNVIMPEPTYTWCTLIAGVTELFHVFILSYCCIYNDKTVYVLTTLCLKKMGHAYYASQLLQMWTDFNNSFTVVFVDELQKTMVLPVDLPPHLKCVSALPRENWMFNCTAIYLYYR